MTRDAAPPPSIVLLTELFPPFVGGTAVLFRETYSRLAQWKVTVLTDGEKSPGSNPVDGSLQIERRRMSSAHWGMLRPAGLLHHVRVAGYVRRLSMKVGAMVHCGRTIPEGIAAALARLAGGSPYWCWVHGEDLTMQMTTSRETRLLTKFVCKQAAGFLANSEFTAGLLADMGIPRQRVHVIYPGVDTARFHPRVDGSEICAQFAPDGGPIILSVGRLQRRKGFDRVIAAVAHLRDSIPDLRYVMVGDGEDRQYLMDLIRQYGVSDRVFSVGRVEDADLPRLYAACDLFVHPNRVEGVDVEGFGIVFLEAAASGKPVIGGRSGGVPEAILDGETGILVSGDDVIELAEAIASILRSPAIAATLGETARRRTEREFTWERTAERLAKAISHSGVAFSGES